MSNEINEIEEQELYERLRIEVDAGQVPLRVDKYLVEHMPHQSRNRIQTVADAGMLLQGLDIEYCAGCHFGLYVAGVDRTEMLYVFIREGEHLAAGMRDDVSAQPERQQKE